VLIRRTLPAMAATLVGFIAVRLAFVEWVRPHLMTPLHTTTAFIAPSPDALPNEGINPGDWITSEQTINGAGRVIGQHGGFGPNGNFGVNAGPNGTLRLSDGQACPSSIRVPKLGGGPGAGPPTRAITNAVQECVNKLHIRQVLTYQPLSRYWAFQWYETALFLGLAFVLAGLCFWWIRRRLS
jgi:hypothetical protein